MARLTPVNLYIFTANESQIHILGSMAVRFHISGILVYADLLVFIGHSRIYAGV